jgi:hypothetical protein
MTPALKDQLIAPKISTFASPRMPSIEQHRKHILRSFIMNYDLSLVISNSMRQLVFNFIRKAEATFDEYCAAAIDLRLYIETTDDALELYFSALRHLEQCLAHLNEATLSLNGVAAQLNAEKQWTRDDGSVLQRANNLHNYVKHFDEKLSKGPFPSEMSFKLFATDHDGSPKFNYVASDVSNTPLWLTNDGLESRDASLTFTELADEVLAFYQQADELACMKPQRRGSS